ncbi:MAG: ornithine cyclodeaminase family protein [Saccharofermentanales bacterium]|jgi:ornithine cyclodeaminase/alanine dehydrogenase-like protein (mu-crystallin family)
MYYADAELVKKFEQEHEFFKTQLKLGEEIIWLTQKECIEAGPTIEETLELVNQAMIYHGRKEYEMPAKIGIHPFDDVFFHAMPAYVPKNLACGMKWIECFPRNPDEYNLPQTTGLLVMNDIMTGVPVAVMDCAWLTAMRTPAVTVLAAAALHPDATTFGMFGCGVQGTEHVRFVGHTLKKLERIYIYDIIPERMDELIEKVKDEVDIEIIKAEPEEVVKSSEVLSSATICVREPIYFGKKEWVSKGQTILPCDLNTFWDPEISLEADKYIVDSIDEHQLFDDMGYFPDGLPEIFCETGEILAGLKEGRTSPDQLIVCSNIGISTNDVSMGHKILFKAIDMGLGIKLKL